MKIVFPYENVQLLQGAVRAMLSFADLCKCLGHSVTVIATPPVEASNAHYSIRQIREYYPLRKLVPRNIKVLNLYEAKEAKRLIEDADLLWTFSHFHARLDEHMCCEPRHHWNYMHYPHLRSGVSINLEKIWCNGTFTLKAVQSRMWPQSADAEVLYPPVPIRKYKCLDWADRDIDIVLYSRISRDKGFNLLGKLKEAFPKANVAAVGADMPSKPWLEDSKPQDAKYNLKFPEIREILAHSKVYLHLRGFVQDPEHLGITCLEAAASACVPIVHESGGPWLDLLQERQGVYGYGYRDWEELMKAVSMVLEGYGKRERVGLRARRRVAHLERETRTKLKNALNKVQEEEKEVKGNES